MKLEPLYPLVLFAASLGSGLAQATPLSPVRVVTVEPVTTETLPSTPRTPREHQARTTVEEVARLQAIREQGKQQAAQAAFALAALSEEDNDKGAAAALLREAVALQPDNTDYLLAASRLAFTLKDYDYTEACLIKVLRIHRHDDATAARTLLVALDNLATLYRVQGKTDAAKAALDEALTVTTAGLGEHHPWVVHSLYRLAELDLIAVNYGEATQHLQRAMTILDTSPSPIDDQDGAALLHNIGELYRLSGQPVEAENAYTKAMALWNKSPTANQRGIALTQAGLDRLHAEQDAKSVHSGLETGPRVDNAQPLSSRLPDSTGARM